MKHSLLSLLCALLLSASPCIAAQKTPDRAAIPAAPVLYLSVQDLDNLEKMPEAKRTAFVQQRRDAWDKMPASKRTRLEASRRKAFDALPMAEQLTLCLRGERLSSGVADAVVADASVPEKKTARAAEKISALDDTQQKQLAEIEKNRRKWANAD